MKHVDALIITERQVEYKERLYMTWEYNDYELAIMDDTGYDVSLMTKVHTQGSTITEKRVYAIDTEGYVESQFHNDELINTLK
jgi:hypothetical protein